MGGQTLASRRRKGYEKYFTGKGLDVGAGVDPLWNCPTWDIEDGDGQYLNGIEDNSLDFLHSSHCLEHLDDPVIALQNWYRVIRVGGYMVVTVPDFVTYERSTWPSRKNRDHKHYFTMESLASLLNFGEVVSLLECTEGFDPLNMEDQTSSGKCECSLEFIVRKNE